jgi:hypothetical protein
LDENLKINNKLKRESERDMDRDRERETPDRKKEPTVKNTARTTDHVEISRNTTKI